MMGLGRLLEISLPAEPVLDSVQFYERMGFAQAITRDLWPHHYGVVSDGRLNLGLHAARITGLTLSWVREDVEVLAEQLRADGVTLAPCELEHEGLHEFGLDGPAGLHLRVLEARSYSPPAELDGRGPLGWFDALRLASSDPVADSQRLEQLGMICTARGDRRAVLSCEGLNLELLREQAGPELCFEHEDPAAVAGELARRDLHPEVATEGAISYRSPECMRISVRLEGT